jgi:hypothetical protein
MVESVDCHHMEIEPIHLLIRFSDKMGAIEDTIEAHREVIVEHRAVWFGKMGKTLASKHVARMNAQCKQKVPTYLYLVQAGKGRSQVYRGTVLEISKTVPSNERRFVPQYYGKNGLTRFMRLWGKLSNVQLMPEGTLSSLYVAGSGSRVSDILHSSMAGLFIVKERGGGPSIIYHFQRPRSD